MTEVTIREAVAQWRKWSSGSVDELAAIGTAFVWSLGLEPLPETTASTQINRRTIRYYISSELMDPPEGERRLATYHQRHLLQLLYIKARQHAGDRLSEIRQDLEGKSGGTLENLLVETLPESIPAPVPADPSEFARPADLNAVLGRWAYLTGRKGRYQSGATPKHSALQNRVAERSELAYTGQNDDSGARFRAEFDLGNDITLDLPADHPLVHDEDGRALVLRGIQRLLRNYHRGGNPAGGEQ